jgi:poly-gamma-glutamate biosynthesis protein PgsC/CapC
MPVEGLFIGLLLALAFTGLTGYYPGGLIVPGYLVLSAEEPVRILGTLVVALLAWLLYRLAATRLLLFGRRRTALMVLLGACGAVTAAALAPALFPSVLELRVIGLVVPGLIANHFERQGVAVTTAALVVVTSAAWLLTLTARVLGLTP